MIIWQNTRVGRLIQIMRTPTIRWMKTAVPITAVGWKTGINNRQNRTTHQPVYTGSYDAQGNSRSFGRQDGEPFYNGNPQNRPPEYGMNENGVISLQL